jgi:molybdopterin molybdotransferase
MVRVEEAEKIILQQSKDFGTEIIPFDSCEGRVLAENIFADRDMPPFNRVIMDGIAIHIDAFKNGIRSFKIKATQSAGEQPCEIENDDECIEIMTGAVLPATTNAVVPYEEIEIKDGEAILKTNTVLIHQNIHRKGIDKKQNEMLVEANQLITPPIITIAATVGKTILQVKKNPTVLIISTGDELVAIHEQPTMFQIRSSNNYTVRAVLKEYGLRANLLHLPDKPDIIIQQLEGCIHEYDVIILTGGVSMGKFDHIPAALEKLKVQQLFHKVLQRPGKPFWFGTHARGAIVFAFPGNPVSTWMCFHRYFLPWLKRSWGIKMNKSYAILNTNFVFKPSLQYFLQIKLHVSEKGELCADPVTGHGSGDFVNLLETDAFMELPVERSDFKKGEVFPIWPFKQMI